jgi:GTPase SAR1 family protein
MDVVQILKKKNKKKIKDKNIKMVFLGENGVGKTYIVERILGKEISTNYEHTKKIIKYKSIYKLDNNKTINVQIIDTNGDSINNNRDLKDYVKHGKIFFLVFDVNKKETFYKLINFVEDIKKYYKKKTILLFLLGNKTKISDDNNSCVAIEDAVQFANQIDGKYEMVPTEDADYFKNFINDYAEKYLQAKF